MANLRYSDKHNMVAFLKKPTKSVGFTEIVDFFKGTSLRTLANKIQELAASIDNKEHTITKASIRSQLKLEDATAWGEAEAVEVRGSRGVGWILGRGKRGARVVVEVRLVQLERTAVGGSLREVWGKGRHKMLECSAYRGLTSIGWVVSRTIEGRAGAQGGPMESNRGERYVSCLYQDAGSSIPDQQNEATTTQWGGLKHEGLQQPPLLRCLGWTVARSASKDKDIGIGMDFLIVQQKSDPNMLNVKVNPGSGQE
ncbi:hypothetical protein Tco_0907689 [Tanacetum coccineum]|uniref:Uncharacterized protein n=1 Tax=Tanacetum coccineum TaxID=301880 RepID=A0ABQ5CRG2_9ASTR